MLRALLLTGLARMPVFALLLESMVLSLGRVSAQEWQPATTAHGQLVITKGLPLALVSGSPSDIGTAEGVLFRDRIKPLLGLMSLQPRLVVEHMIDQFDAFIAQGVEGSTYYGPSPSTAGMTS